MSSEQRATQAITRMSEFYEPNELVQWVDFCTDNHFPQDEAALFLDGQTRFNYQMGMAVRILNYMGSYYEYKH